MFKRSTLGVAALVLTACGGGGGGAPAPTKATPILSTSISGIVTPPVAVGKGTATPSTTMLTPPNSTGSWSAIVQSMDYTFDPAAAAGVPPALKATTLKIKPVDTTTGSFRLTTGGANPTNPAVGQATSITNTVAGVASTLSTVTPSVVAKQSTLAGLTATVLTDATTVSTSGYALPYSATNPQGYLYQTFGAWFTTNPTTKVFSEHYFSAGVITTPGTLPVAGTARYTGAASGSWVNAVTRDISDTSAAMSATANFAARTVAFATTGTTSLSANAALGTLPSANPRLNMSGMLNYAAGSNSFTGTVSTANGMTGNATGRFYGPGIVTATPNQVLGAPPEIGGTFSVMKSGVGGMQGAFGGSGSHPPTIVPKPTSMTGTFTPPVAPAAGFMAGTNLLTPVNASYSVDSVIQETTLLYDPTAILVTPSAQKVTSLNVLPVNTSFANFLVTTGAVAYPLDPALGQPSSASLGSNGVGYGWSLINGGVLSQSKLAGLTTATYTNTNVFGISVNQSYVLPYSATLNPNGYTYQTFGLWAESTTTVAGVHELYFSGGVATGPATLPTLGTASYIGAAAGSYVNSITNDFSHTTATMSATANFATRSLAFSTTGTTSLSINAVAGTLPTANAGLNMNGTLSYAAGNNTFTGAVTTTNGMTGNATGRFYGPGIATATPSKSVGAPPEIGGTFAVKAVGVGAMQGAFGGK